jgi:hypothetical protein
VEGSNWKSSLQDEFIWECQTNADPWDETQTPEWTPYSNAKSSAIEKAYKNKSKEILIDENYRIDLENCIQQHINDPYRQRPVRRRRCRPHSIVPTDKETEDESAYRERLSSPLGLVSSYSATGDTTYYGSSFVHTWLVTFTKGKMKITFDTIYPVLLKGLMLEGQIAKTNTLTEIEAVLIKIKEETSKKSSEKRIKELQDCCAKLYTKSCYIYGAVNAALRNDDRSKLDTLGPFCYLLFNYVGRRFKDNSSILDRFRRVLHPNEIEWMTLYRGDYTSDTNIEEYRRAARDNSKHFKWLPFVSTSRDRKVAEFFAGNVLYIIKIRSYSSNEDRFTDLSEISHFPIEQEILLLPGVQFQVNKVSFDNENGLHLVYIKINSSYISKLK